MYLLNINKLETGDIILMRSNSEISQVVRRLTKSEYSHAILYVGISSCIESDGYGVQAQNIQRVLFDDLESVRVLRLNKDEQKSGIQDVIVFARQKIGTEYSIAEAKLALLKREEDAKESNRQFCTRFVAQAYESAGIQLVDNANYCNPADLLKSESLIGVPDVLREASEKEIEFAKSESPLEKQANIHNLIFSSVRSISGTDIQTFEQLSKFVIENPDKEAEITKVVEDSGYLTMWQSDLNDNPWHYDYNKFIQHYKNPEQAVDVAVFFATTESETRQRFIQNLHVMKMGYMFRHQKYFMNEIQLCEKLIELSKQRENTALKVLKG